MRYKDIPQKLLEILSDGKTYHISTLYEMTGCNRAYVGRHLHTLTQSGDIKRVAYGVYKNAV